MAKKQKSEDEEIYYQMRDYKKDYSKLQTTLTEKEIAVCEYRKKTVYSLLRMLTGIFLLSLIIVYSDALLNAAYTISSRQSASIIDSNYSINYKDYKIILNLDIYKKILAIHDSSNGNEIKVCLLGEIDNNNYKISAIYIPEIISQSGIHISSEMCDRNTIISLHSHSVDNCFFSKEDIDAYKITKYNNNAMMGIMCSQTRFNFYKEN